METIGPRTKYWAEAVQDLVKLPELYGVMAAALSEAYREGQRTFFMEMLFELDHPREVIDIEAGGVEDSNFSVPQGPELAGPALFPEEPSGAAGPTEAPRGVPRGGEEGPARE